MAYWTSGVLMAFAPPTDMPIDFGLRIDRQTFAYAGGHLARDRRRSSASRRRGRRRGPTRCTRSRKKPVAGRAAGARAAAAQRAWSWRRSPSVSCCSSAPGCSCDRCRRRRTSIPDSIQTASLIASVDLLPNGYTRRHRPPVPSPLVEAVERAARRRVGRARAARCRSA